MNRNKNKVAPRNFIDTHREQEYKQDPNEAHNEVNEVISPSSNDDSVSPTTEATLRRIQPKKTATRKASVAVSPAQGGRQNIVGAAATRCSRPLTMTKRASKLENVFHENHNDRQSHPRRASVRAYAILQEVTEVEEEEKAHSEDGMLKDTKKADCEGNKEDVLSASDLENYQRSSPDDPAVCHNRLLQYFAKMTSSNELEVSVDLDFIQTLIKSGASVKATDNFGQTVIHEVARAWGIEVAQFLLEKGTFL